MKAELVLMVEGSYSGVYAGALSKIYPMEKPYNFIYAGLLLLFLFLTIYFLLPKASLSKHKIDSFGNSIVDRFENYSSGRRFDY